LVQKVGTVNWKYYGRLIPPLLSLIYFAPFLLGDLKFIEGCKKFGFDKNRFSTPLKGGSAPQKWTFKVLAITCCGYSKLVSQDAWYNAKGQGDWI
jgi:hypothetical protein